MGWLEGRLQFSFGHIQLVVQGHDFQVFFLVGLATDADQLDEDSEKLCQDEPAHQVSAPIKMMRHHFTTDDQLDRLI